MGWRALPGSLRSGALLLVFAVAVGILGLFLIDPNDQDLAAAYVGPGSAGHPLGTDALGHDVLAWVAAGVRTSIQVAGAVVLIAAVVGTTVGLVAGYLAGIADTVLMRLVDLQLAVPPLLLFIAASATVGNSMLALILLVSAVSWVPYARVVRTQVMVERRRASVAAARLAGVSRRRILFVHLLPASASMVLVLATLQFGFVLLVEAGLSFVGFGVQPPDTSLGYLIAQGRLDLETAWWVVAVPGGMLALLLVAANLVGEGLQELFGVDVDLVDR
jgi:peptide/nickel transport system permease protein